MTSVHKDLLKEVDYLYAYPKNKVLLLSGLEPRQQAILRLLVRRFNKKIITCEEDTLAAILLNV
jgi:hypothetical protein